MEGFIFLVVIGLGVHSSHQSNDRQESIRTSDSEVEDNSRYKTLEANATLLKLLVNNKSGVSGTEVFDMLHSRDDHNDHVDLPTFPRNNGIVRADLTNIPDTQAEYLQASGDIVLKDSQLHGVQMSNDAHREPVGLAAGIMVAITCTVVCAAYAALIIWRRLEMKRNGLKHELLRNEDVAETRIEL